MEGSPLKPGTPWIERNALLSEVQSCVASPALAFADAPFLGCCNHYLKRSPSSVRANHGAEPGQLQCRDVRVSALESGAIQKCIQGSKTQGPLLMKEFKVLPRCRCSTHLQYCASVEELYWTAAAGSISYVQYKISGHPCIHVHDATFAMILPGV